MPTRNRRSASPRVPAWAWLFTGALLGALIMFLVQLSEVKVAKTNSDTTPKHTETPHPSRPAQFDFYTRFAEDEVAVGKEADKESVKEPPKTALPATKAPAQLEYFLQVASFSDPADADELRVKMLLLGMEARVEPASVRNGETWHRVVVGPFAAREQQNQARQQLLSKGYETLHIQKEVPAR